MTRRGERLVDRFPEAARAVVDGYLGAMISPRAFKSTSNSFQP